MIIEREKYIFNAAVFVGVCVITLITYKIPALGIAMLSLGLFTILAFIRPMPILYVAIGLLPVWASFEIQNVDFTFLEVVVGFLLSVCLLRWMLERKIQTVLLEMPTPWILAFIVAASIGAISNTPNPVVAFNMMRKALVMPVAFYLLIIGLVDDREKMIKALWIFAAANSVAAAYGIYDHLVLMPDIRAGYSFSSPVFLGMSCMCGAVVSYRLWSIGGGLRRRLAELFFVAQVACLALTLTRVAVFCLIAMPFVDWLLFKTKHKNGIIVSALVVVSVLIFSFSLGGEFGTYLYAPGTQDAGRFVDLSQYQDSVYLRADNWLSAINVFREHKLFGHGFYPFSELGGTWRTTGLSHPHSILMNLLVSGGIVGAIMFILFILDAMRRTWPTCFGSTIEASAQRLIFLLVWALLMNGMVNGVLTGVPGASLFFFFLGMLVAVQRVVKGSAGIWSQ